MKKLKILLPIIAAMSLSGCTGFINNIIDGLNFSDESSTQESSSENTSSTNSSTSIDPQGQADYTILMYMCGSDLESDYGMATLDIQEMLNKSCPSNVNIVIETGGSRKWGLWEYSSVKDDYVYKGNPYNISNTKLGRYHIEGKNLVKDAQITNSSMGNSSTLQSFIEWGFGTYPAKQTGLILWNHGGAMGGCCFDDYYNDSLTSAEVNTAVKNAMTTLKRTEKFTWIGYDCCLMSVADIASVNAQYFDYMVASQESEAGEGWDYDSWLPSLYNNANIAPTELLPQICTSFIQDYENTYGGYYDNDQTLSVLDLSKMDAFISAFETYSQALNISNSTGFNKIKTAYNNSLRFGYDGDLNAYLFGVADFKDFLTKMKNQFSSVSNTALLSALNDLVIYNAYGSSGYSSTKPCGLSVFVAYAKQVTVSDGTYGLQCSKQMYTTKDTLFTTWRNININYGF